jgi:hypothetical protein
LRQLLEKNAAHNEVNGFPTAVASSDSCDTPVAMQ